MNGPQTPGFDSNLPDCQGHLVYDSTMTNVDPTAVAGRMIQGTKEDGKEKMLQLQPFFLFSFFFVINFYKIDECFLFKISVLQPVKREEYL